MTARGDIESYGTLKEVAPNAGFKVIIMETAVSFIGGTDTFTVDLTAHGGRLPVAIFATYQSTTNAVLAASTALVSATTAGVAIVETAASGTGVYGVVMFFR